MSGEYLQKRRSKIGSACDCGAAFTKCAGLLLWKVVTTVVVLKGNNFKKAKAKM
jgi:hypothetical protein